MPALLQSAGLFLQVMGLTPQPSIIAEMTHREPVQVHCESAVHTPTVVAKVHGSSVTTGSGEPHVA
jgi:hypothetical protein